MNNYIPLSVPNLKGNELKYVTDAINTEWVSTGGSYISKFENMISKYVNVKKAVACQSGTAGLHIALNLCGVVNNDEVIVPTLTFIAAVNPVKYVGADPIFMDCDDSLTMNADKLRVFCEQECSFNEGSLINKKTNKHIKAIIVVHVFGNMAHMESIMDIAKKFNLMVIEDATEALGTYYTEGRFAGKFAGTIGHIGVYSFNGNKIITTGGGGMIVSDNVEMMEKAQHLTTQAKADELYYIHDEIGYNYRMTNVQAAIGVAQLEQLESFIAQKKKNYYLYKNALDDIKGLSILDFKDEIRPNFWFYSVYCHDEYKFDRDELIKYLQTNQIQSRPIWGLINEQKPYINSQSYNITTALKYWKHVVNIPCSSNLNEKDVLYIIECLLKCK